MLRKLDGMEDGNHGELFSLISFMTLNFLLNQQVTHRGLLGIAHCIYLETMFPSPARMPHACKENPDLQWHHRVKDMLRDFSWASYHDFMTGYGGYLKQIVRVVRGQVTPCPTKKTVILLY